MSLRPLRTALALLGAAGTPLAAQVAAGNAAWSAGRYDAAKAAYERELTGNPRSVRALYRLAVLASWDDRLDSALVLLRRARAVEPADPDVRVTEAEVLAWRGRLDAALIRYDSLVAEYPDRRDARLGRAHVLGWQARYGEAESTFRSLLLDNPEDAAALSGLGQIARWRGEDAAAADYTRRALRSDSTNRDARVLARELRAVLGPQLELTGGWNNDSDGNTNWSEGLTLSTGLGAGLRAFASGGVQQSRDPARTASRSLAEGGIALGHAALDLVLAGGARRLVPDGAPVRSVATYRASASVRAARGTRVGVSFAHLPLDETALLIGSGLDIDVLDASADARLGSELELSLGGGAAWVSDGNRRVSGVGALIRTFGRHAFAGVYGRVLDYQRHGAGYFSPDRFGMAEARAGLMTRSRGWDARLSGGLGVQQTRGSATQAEWHVEARAGRHWAGVNLVEIFGGVTNSVASSINGAFRYRSAGLRIVLGI